jgi:hypothetical protein
MEGFSVVQMLHEVDNLDIGVKHRLPTACLFPGKGNSKGVRSKDTEL